MSTPTPQDNSKKTIHSANPQQGSLTDVRTQPIVGETFNGIVVIGKPADVAAWLSKKVDELGTAKPVDHIYVGQNDGMGNPYAAVFLVHEIGNGRVNLSQSMIEAFVPNAEQAVALNSASSYGKVMAPDTTFRPLMEMVFSNDPAWVTAKVIEAATLVLTSLYDLNGNVFGTSDIKLRLGIENPGQTRVTVSTTLPAHFHKEPIDNKTYLTVDPVDGTLLLIDGAKNQVKAQPYAHNLQVVSGGGTPTWTDEVDHKITLSDNEKLGRIVDYDSGKLTINVLDANGAFKRLATATVIWEGDYITCTAIGVYDEMNLDKDDGTVLEVVGLGYGYETIGVMLKQDDGDGYNGYASIPMSKIPAVGAAFAA